jgi:ABC-type branched-subunit amino acid transport system ATPase component
MKRKSRSAGHPGQVFHYFPKLKTVGQMGKACPARAADVTPRGPWWSVPKLLIIDEPTEGLAPNNLKDLGNAEKAPRKHGHLSIGGAEYEMSLR